jgi:hypothetical protein
MKSTSTILSLVVSLIFGGLAFGQQTVTLVCNPALIYEEGPIGACYFLPGEEDQNPETYETIATVGEVITWVGQSTKEDDTIDIFMIKYQGGVNVFDQDELEGENSVRGTISKATPEDEPYKYEIRFKINSTGKLYKIDPIIRTRAQ